MMAESRGVACTAGFESLNEAAWFGKPLLVVPVENHIEQHLNALDAQKAGLALAATRFDLTPLLRRWKTANLESYRSWVRKAGPVLLSVTERVICKPARTFVQVCALDVAANPCSALAGSASKRAKPALAGPH